DVCSSDLIRLLIEVVDREQCRRTLARCGSQNWGIGERESAIIEEISSRLNDLGAYPQNRCLARGTDPQMAMVHQEIDAMFLQRNRKRIVVLHALQDLHVRHIQLISARSAFVSPHLALNDDARFL